MLKLLAVHMVAIADIPRGQTQKSQSIIPQIPEISACRLRLKHNPFAPNFVAIGQNLPEIHEVHIPINCSKLDTSTY